jgi:hypothetical protein
VLGFQFLCRFLFAKMTVYDEKSIIWRVETNYTRLLTKIRYEILVQKGYLHSLCLNLEHDHPFPCIQKNSRNDRVSNVKVNSFPHKPVPSHYHTKLIFVSRARRNLDRWFLQSEDGSKDTKGTNSRHPETDVISGGR